MIQCEHLFLLETKRAEAVDTPKHMQASVTAPAQHGPGHVRPGLDQQDEQGSATGAGSDGQDAGDLPEGLLLDDLDITSTEVSLKGQDGTPLRASVVDALEGQQLGQC